MRLATLPRLLKLTLILVAVLVYLGVYFVFWPLLGASSTVFSFLPVVIASILFGMWGGVVGSIFIALLDVGLFLLEGPSGLVRNLRMGTAGFVSLFVGGVIVGRLSDLSRRFGQELVERKRIEVALRQSEARWRMYFEKANDLIFTLDSDGLINSVNQAAFDTLGYRSDELLGHDPIEYVAPEARPKVTPLLQEILNGGPGKRVDIEVLSKNGSRLTLEIRGFSIYDQGRLVETFHIARDIGQRKKVEAALRASEERYRGLFATAQRQAQELALLEQVRTALAREIAMPVIYRTIVDAIAQHFSYEQISIYILQADILVLQEQLGYDHVFAQIPLTKGICGRVASTGQPVLLEDVQGDPIFLGAIEGIVSEVCVPLMDGGRVVGVLNVESANGRKLGADDLRRLNMLSEHIGIALGRARYYAEVRESETRFRKVFEEGPFGMAMVNLDGRLMEVNPMFCQILGYTEPELKNMAFGDFTHPEDLAADLEYARQLIAGQLPEYKLEQRFIRKDGQVVWSSLTATTVRDEAGAVLYVLLMVDDITGRKRIEAAEREQRLLAEVLRDTGALLNSTLQFENVLESILSNAKRVVPHDAASIMLVENETARVVGCREYNLPGLEDATLGLQIKISDTPHLRHMAETGSPMAIPETRGSPHWREFAETYWVRSYAGAPIQIKNQTVGFLSLESAIPDFFNHSHAEGLQAFANQAAAAIENARLYGNLQQYARQMALLNEITHFAVSAPSIRQMLNSVVSRLAELIGADGAYITLWDAARQEPVPVAAYGPLDDFYSSIQIEPGEITMTSSALQAGHALAVEDVFNSPYVSARLAALFPESSLLGLPLIADDRKLGAALLSFRQPHHFTADEIALGEQAAVQIALAIAKSQLLEAERQRTSQLSRANSLILALGHVAAQAETASDPDGVIETLGSELKKLGVNCLVALPAAETKGLVIRYLSIEPPAIKYIETVAGKRLDKLVLTPDLFPYYEEVISARQPLFLTDVEPNISPFFPGPQQPLVREIVRLVQVTPATRIICLPLIAEDHVLGFLALWGEGLEAGDLPAASIFGSQVAIALENARLYSKVQQMAITDELTGFYNRRGLFEFGRREVERSARFNRPLCAVMLDIDHFKQVNDRFGHPLGDQVLHGLAERCRSHVREIDIFGRYGGEEFVLLLPENDIAMAYVVAERLRQVVAEMPLETDQGEISITISLGVTAATQDTKDLPSLIERADQALYLAKHSGRNRVAVR